MRSPSQPFRPRFPAERPDPGVADRRCAGFVLLRALLAVLVVLPMAAAAASEKVLVVPALDNQLQLTVALPEGLSPDVKKSWQLVEVDHDEIKATAQLLPAMAADGTLGAKVGRLAAVIPPRAGAEGHRRFRLVETKPTEVNGFRFRDVSDKTLAIDEGSAPVMAYNHGTITCERVPESDHRRSRACYIHPLWGLSGEVLTDDFPRDHHHHHGVYWTWPHVGIDGREYDIWAGSKIWDRFQDWIAREAGPVAALLAVDNAWFIQKEPGKGDFDRKVMLERVWMQPYAASNDERAIDLDLFFVPHGQPVTLWGAGGKSYGGLTVRFAPKSAKESTIIVEEGVTKADLPDTPLKWADFTTQYEGVPHESGGAVFIHPAHPDYPPTWLTRHYGPLCVGWPGVNKRTFEPGRPIHLQYRLWLHKKPGEHQRLMAEYEAFLAATKARWE